MPKNRRTEELADRLHSTAIHLLRMVRVQDAKGGTGPARLSALSVVVFGGPQSLNDLARAEQVKPPTMSRIVDGLEKAGLVTRKANAADRRAVAIEATAKGKALLQEGRRRRVRMLAERLEELSEAELANINRAIDAIVRVLVSKSG